MKRLASVKQIKMGIEESLRKITILQARIEKEELILVEWKKALKDYHAHLQQIPAPLERYY